VLRNELSPCAGRHHAETGIGARDVSAFDLNRPDQRTVLLGSHIVAAIDVRPGRLAVIGFERGDHGRHAPKCDLRIKLRIGQREDGIDRIPVVIEENER
jgi:hypothetical protein